MISQRRWYYAGRWLSFGVNKRRRRAFLARWDAFHDLWSPLGSLIFWTKNPRLYLRVKRAVRLRRMGRVEVPA